MTLKHAIMFGVEGNLTVVYPDSVYSVPYVARWNGKDVANFGRFSLNFVRDVVKESQDLCERRVIARIVPDDVLERVEAIDEEIETLDKRIRTLGLERQEVLAAAVPRARLVRREDLPTKA